MQKWVGWACWISVVLLCRLGVSQATAQDIARVNDAPWRELFDGRTLAGWVQRGGRARFEVRDGAIVGSTVTNTPNSFLCTDRDYGDFILELDFKVDEGLNSGVQIRSQSRADYRNGVVHGYQVEIDPSPRAWTGGIYDESRRGWLNDLTANEPARQAFKHGEWNHFRVEARGAAIRTWLNGSAAADLEDSLTPRGFIALQVHASASTRPLQVRWRNIRLQDLGEGAKKSTSKNVRQGSIKFTLEAGDHEYRDTPVEVPLPGCDLPAGPCLVVDLRDGEPTQVTGQIQPGSPAAGGSPSTLSFVLNGVMLPGSKRTYKLCYGGSSNPSITLENESVSWSRNGRALDLFAGARPVLRYNTAFVPPPAGASPLYARGGFIHPLWSPGGAVLTGIHPADHIHHLGLWDPWTHTTFEGHAVDFWNLALGQGTVRFKGFRDLTGGPVWGGFTAEQEHVDLTTTGTQKVTLREDLSVRAWRIDEGGLPENARRWIIDYTTTQRCATDRPIQLLQYRYGGFGFRATPAWDAAGAAGAFTSEGRTRADANETRARWADIQGSTDKGPAGLLFMSDPANFDHPETIRLYPDNGLFFAFCSTFNRDWQYQPGQDYTRRYRILVHEGAITAEEAERAWQDFAHPPKVTVESGE